MKFTDIKNQNGAELMEMLKGLQVKLGKLNFELSQNNLKDFSQIGKVKKDIARILTALGAVKNS